MKKKHNFLIIFSGIFFTLVVLVAIFLPLFPGFNPNHFDPLLIGDPLSPSLAHPFGTDDLGRDIFQRAVVGARISLMVAVVSVAISSTLGLLIGLVAGFIGGKVDRALMAFVDIMLAIPTIFLILTIQVMLTPNIMNVMVVIGLTSWMGVARLVRAEAMSLKERLFVIAARSRAIPESVIVFKHVLPLTLGPVGVASVLGMGGAILTEAVLSFLGLGVQPPHASWGNMLQGSLAYMMDAPWMAIVPGTLITLTVLAINFIGDYLTVQKKT